ncbi:MAG: hypothetical protein WCA13_03265 [Terriglobales bacterium]
MRGAGPGSGFRGSHTFVCRIIYRIELLETRRAHQLCKHTEAALECFKRQQSAFGGLVDLCSAIQSVLFVVIVAALVEPLGGYMERVFSRERTAFDRYWEH